MPSPGKLGALAFVRAGVGPMVEIMCVITIVIGLMLVAGHYWQHR